MAMRPGNRPSRLAKARVLIETRWLRWLELRYRHQLAKRGKVLFVAPEDIANVVRAAIYHASVETAAAKWAGREAGVALKDWRQAMVDKGQVIGTWHDGRKGAGGDSGAPPR